MNLSQSVDITPSPRILRTLGEIPFAPWQCLAELIDNAVDALVISGRENTKGDRPLVSVTWSTEAVSSTERTVEVIDNGPGMSLEQLTDAARAGYTSNDPINNLGLFGMGFNIATARLGERTRFLSTRDGDPDWCGIEIDFESLIVSGSFDAKVVRQPKTDVRQSGTQITIGSLRDGIFSELRDKEGAIRRQLEVIYSPLLSTTGVAIRIQGKTLFPKRSCVWGANRQTSVQTLDRPVPAIISIDQVLGVALFDLKKGTYLSIDAEADAQDFREHHGAFPDGIVEREKRLHGWVGIQRYSDPNDFGIDFVRNGRKILIRNKDLFQFISPFTGTSRLEYPVELGSTVGGRIVGELHVDYLRPTYQKNDFDRSDLSWQETVLALRGEGPMLPKERKLAGYEGPNTSPLGLLTTAFRRMDPGTKCLVISRETAREFLKRFEAGDIGFQDDSKWWTAAQEEDRQRATGGAGKALPVDEGDQPSDNFDDYEPGSENSESPAASPVPPPSPSVAPDSTVNDLINHAVKIESLSRSMAYGTSTPFEVSVWEVRGEPILESGARKPCKFHRDGIDCRFFYDPSHSIFRSTSVTPSELLTITLAEQFKLRDNQRDLIEIYTKLIERSVPERRLDKSSLFERSASMVERISEGLVTALSDDASEVLEFAKESSGDAEEIVRSILDNPNLLDAFQNSEPAGIDALRYAGVRTIIRLVDRFPSLLLDGHLFKAPYQGILLDDPAATARAREESKDRITSLLKDVMGLMRVSGFGTKATSIQEELVRCQQSLTALEKEIVD